MERDFREETMTAPLLRQAPMRRVAVFRALQLGDMLCAVPALRALRTALPDAHITLVGLPWAAQFAGRFAAYVDAFHAFPGHEKFPEQSPDAAALPPFYRAMQEADFDLALQLHGSGEISNGIVRRFGARHAAGYVGAADDYDARCWFPYPGHGPEPLRLLNLLTLLGAPPAGTQLEFPLHAQDWDELRAGGLAASLVPGSYFCIHPGARFRDKCWPPQRFAAVADSLAQEFGLKTVITGSAQEADLADAVAAHMRTPALHAAAPLSIGAMAALMSGARLLICNDTGVSHIAAGLRLKSVVVFSKADIDRWAPLDLTLHRCIADPLAAKGDEVLEQARMLLAEHAPGA